MVVSNAIAMRIQVFSASISSEPQYVIDIYAGTTPYVLCRGGVDRYEIASKYLQSFESAVLAMRKVRDGTTSA